ncbi:MAG TPA: hypothetical protein VGP93_01385, partial [Polyangiaceae bacterium]|nr:hypothetical protein [Polyangiaceae bacterium]
SSIPTPSRAQAKYRRSSAAPKNTCGATAFAAALGLPSSSRYAVGTEVAVEGETLGRELVERYPKALVVAGQIIFDEDTAWNRALHNETAFTIQRRLQRVGVPMIVLPVQLNLSALGTDKPVRRQAGHLAA